MPIRTLVITLLFSSMCFADLNDVANRLVEDKSKVAEQVTALNFQSAGITEEIKRLQDEQSALYGQIHSLTQNRVTIVLSEEIFAEVIMKPMDHCQIQAGQLPGEYQIRHRDEKIRVVFPKDILETSGRFQIRKFSVTQKDILEIKVDSFVNVVSPPENFSATIRLDLTTLEVLQATFIGQKLNDRMFGWDSSYNRGQITCAL